MNDKDHRYANGGESNGEWGHGDLNQDPGYLEHAEDDGKSLRWRNLAPMCWLCVL
jgi:hypothetical protein